MKVVITKKEHIVRIFTSERVPGQFAFWLGKCLRDIENETGYKFFLTEGIFPKNEHTFWGVKILDFESDAHGDAIEELIRYIRSLIENKTR